MSGRWPEVSLAVQIFLIANSKAKLFDEKTDTDTSFKGCCAARVPGRSKRK